MFFFIHYLKLQGPCFDSMWPWMWPRPQSWETVTQRLPLQQAAQQFLYFFQNLFSWGNFLEGVFVTEGLKHKEGEEDEDTLQLKHKWTFPGNFSRTWGAPVGVTGESSTPRDRFFKRWAAAAPNSVTSSFRGKSCRSFTLTNPRAWSLFAVWCPTPENAHVQNNLSVIKNLIISDEKSLPGTFRRPLRQLMMSLTFSGSSVVCWLGLKAPDTSLARSLLEATPAQPVRPSLLWTTSLSSAAISEPRAKRGWALASTSAPEKERKTDFYYKCTDHTESKQSDTE